MPSVFYPTCVLLVGGLLAACDGGGASSPDPAATGGAATTGGTATGGAATGGVPVGALVNANFEARTAGPYSQALVVSDFAGAPTGNNGLSEGRATIVAEAGNQFLRVSYPAGKFGSADGGVHFKVPLASSHDELYLSYRVRFAVGYSFVKGGKLPGLVGGSAPTGCVALKDGFSARAMWRVGGAAVQYMYWPDKKNTCGDDFDYLDAGANVTFVPGTWHRLVHHVVMNAAGQLNGVIEAWFDGKPVLSRRDLGYRVAGQTFGIDALYFSTFFGGNDPSWAPATAQTVDFDDFVVSPTPL